jgi:CheY-like chemotaxis protein
MLDQIPDEEQAVTGKRYVLIVDDEQETLKLLSRLLQQIGLPALTALDASAALAVLEEQGAEVGVILLDLALPGMDGFELFETIRANPDTAEILVVVITALGPETRTRSFEMGMDGYLAKPFTLKQLKEVLIDIGILAPNGS